ncbi:PorT family protein [Chryseobacterium nematophagum]|uniref:PorT family protein n=2 Tax=Chryseobacterium nematophagum TaxID=2305228 RepID=A0A3M7TDL2_9FLAO|nr:PorT family protein [Chryseobacterium nematophagum]
MSNININQKNRMKKLFLGLAVIACSFMSAQKSEYGVKFGAKAGFNFSSILVDGEKIGNSKTGVHFGGFVNIPLGRVVSIQPEVFYSQTGFKKDTESFSEVISLSDGRTSKVSLETNRKANLDYISVPVMFQFKIVDGFYLEAGPQLNFLINNKQSVDLNYLVDGLSQEERKIIDSKIQNLSNSNKKFNTSGVEFGVAVGTGYYFTPNIGVNVRYSFSASPIVDQNGTSAIYNEGDHKSTSLLQLGLVYKF